ncbi:probable sodium/metabolite cotransporter BASS1, chloroplastic isoform X2 [Cryptomeria japonica]|uniref:probable sodium/metabolite cotransporter BASS1, chloroplastic isoform X2 n=1 Tax=Cryptomeria japonica TaxID=3369 RepID=UPI0027DA5D67|nr:probable sodium/metabolite cotransporter BASS1, chloroplastic isoform X2 [Cryptomeria japonica]
MKTLEAALQTGSCVLGGWLCRFSFTVGPEQLLARTGMAMTLSLKDLQGALVMPKELLGGMLLQYTVMPILGALLSKLLCLPSHYAAGLILLSCCPGGTSSNVVTYLARGNVALSVIMTATSTVLAVIMTPMLTAKLAGQYVAVDAGGLLASTLQVVLLPVLTGAIINQYLPSVVNKISPFTAPVAVVSVSSLCASVVAQNSSIILSSGGQVVVAVGALHSAGFLFGYVLSKVLGFNESTSRTTSIEVGMQNSILGLVLAGQHFSNPLTAVPSAVSSVCQLIFGSALAWWWRMSCDNEI